MILTQTSVSQVESFDPDQYGGCNRRFWFERKHDLRQDQTGGQSDGDKGHALLAQYLISGAMPAKRTKMGKHVTGAILKGDLPQPGPDLFVEERFSGQEKYDAAGKWIPLDVENTLHLGGLPWEGFIDLAYRRSEIPVILDHKFGSDIHANAKLAHALIKTVQLPIYVRAMQAVWPDADRFKIAHHSIARSGIDSFIRSAVVTLADVNERCEQIADLLQQMKAVALTESQEDVPFNRRACDAWGGCPHQSICSAFRRNQVNMTPEEAALFDDVPPAGAAAAPDPAAAAKAARIAKARADLAALENEPEADAAPVPAPQPTPPAPRKRPEFRITDDQIPDSTPTPEFPDCAGCGAKLSADNASRLSGGAVKHIGCPKGLPAAPVLPPDAPKSNPAAASASPAAPPVKPTRQPRRPKVEAAGPEAESAALDGATERVGEREARALHDARTVVTFELGPETLAALVKLLTRHDA